MKDIWLLCSLELSSRLAVKNLYDKLSVNFKDKVKIVVVNEVVLKIENGEFHLTSLDGSILQVPKICFVILRSFDTCFDREIILLRHLELLGCKTINSSKAILNCVNKFAHLQLLNAHGLPIPKTIYAANCHLSDVLEHEFIQNKVIVKNARSARGKNVFLSKSIEMLGDIVHCLESNLPYLAQEYIEESRGKVLKIVVIGNQIAHSIIRRSATDLLKDKRASDVTTEIITGKFSEIEKAALKAVEIGGLDFGGVDVLVKNDGSFTMLELKQRSSLNEWDENVMNMMEDLVKKFL